jgi:hypothetical protein
MGTQPMLAGLEQGACGEVWNPELPLLSKTCDSTGVQVEFRLHLCWLHLTNETLLKSSPTPLPANVTLCRF